MAVDLVPHEGDLEPDEDYEGVLFDGTSFADADAGHCHFLDCSFLAASFDGGRLRKARFTDVTLHETRFVGTDLAETGWQDVTLSGCALAGVQAFSAAMRRVTFRGGKLDSVNFRSGTLTEVTFEDCLLRDAEFGGATLRRVSFAGCTLARADFAKASCAEVDLRGAELGISGGYESLGGTTIDSVRGRAGPAARPPPRHHGHRLTRPRPGACRCARRRRSDDWVTFYPLWGCFDTQSLPTVRRGRGLRERRPRRDHGSP